MASIFSLLGERTSDVSTLAVCLSYTMVHVHVRCDNARA